MTGRALAAGEVHVWTVRIDRPRRSPAWLRGLLAVDELARAAAMRGGRDSRRFLVTRAALRSLLGRYLDEDAGMLRFQAGRWGKPELAPAGPLRFNVSHSGDLALIAVAWEREVGVDVERLRGHPGHLRIAERLFATEEAAALRAAGASRSTAAFLAQWTMREAYAKALGEGMALLLRQRGVPAGRLAAAGWTLGPLWAPAGYVAALAVKGEPAAVRHRRWPQ